MNLHELNGRSVFILNYISPIPKGKSEKYIICSFHLESLI